MESKKLVTLYCENCSKEFQGAEPQTCCSGRDCGCMGQPIEPIVCSSECYSAVMNRYKEPSPTPQVQSGLSAEEVLKKHLNTHIDTEYWMPKLSAAMEEYAASKVAEKEREIIRLIGLLKVQFTGSQYQTYRSAGGSIIDANFQSLSDWPKYCEANNIQQPDKL